MNARRGLQLLAVLIVAAVAVWVARNTYWDYVTVDNPPKGAAVGNRYYTFEKLTHRFAIRTMQLPTLRTLPATSDVLIVDDLRGAMLDVGALEKWVAGGGRLLLSPVALLSNASLRSWSGIGRAAPKTMDDEGPALAAPRTRAPEDECPPYSERIAGRETGKSLHACLGTMRSAYSSLHTPAWSLSNGYGFEMLRVDIGKGSIAVIACECMLGNRSLLRGDHARILFDSIPLKAGDHIEILNPVSAESLLALLWRLAAAAIVCALLAVGLTIWRNLPRFGRIAVPAPPLRRSLAEQIRASARFAWRTRHLASLRRAEHQALVQLACRRLAFFERMDSAQRIQALATRTGLDVGALREAMSDGADGGAESQRTAIMLLERARRQLNQ